MTLKILEEKNNPLFNRKEIIAALESETTPSRSHVLELLSKNFSVPMENIKIKSVKGKFGTRNFTIEANIYNSAKDKDAIELKKKKESVAAAPQAAPA